MPLNFPTNPVNNQTYSYGTQMYIWANNYGAWQGSNSASYSTANALSQSFISDGTTTVWTLSTAARSQNNILVTIDGTIQVPGLHYTISANTLTLGTAAPQYSIIEARNFENGTGATLYGVTTGKSIAMAIVFGG